MILGPFAEEELRQALQISNGDISGLIEPFSIVVYCIVALILLWPVVRQLLPRKALPSVLEEAAHEIEESHHHHGMTSAVSVERHVGDDDRTAQASGTGPRATTTRSVDGPPGGPDRTARPRAPIPPHSGPSSDARAGRGPRVISPVRLSAPGLREQRLEVAHVDAGAVPEAGHHRLQPPADGRDGAVEQRARPRHPDPLAGDGEHQDGGDDGARTATEPTATGSPADSASRPIAGGPPSRPV